MAKIVQLKNAEGEKTFPKVYAEAIYDKYGKPLFTIEDTKTTFNLPGEILFNLESTAGKTALKGENSIYSSTTTYLFKHSHGEANQEYEVMSYEKALGYTPTAGDNTAAVQKTTAGKLYVTLSGTIAGTSESANRLEVGTVGGPLQPVYFKEGVPEACSFTIPTNAVFTDTNYYHTPDYSTGLKIATGTGKANMYVPKATASAFGVTKPSAVRSSTITPITGTTLANHYYGVELDSAGKMFVNIQCVSLDMSNNQVFKYNNATIGSFTKGTDTYFALNLGEGANNTPGRLRIYNSGGKYYNLYGASQTTANYTLYLPAENDTLATQTYVDNKLLGTATTYSETNSFKADIACQQLSHPTSGSWNSKVTNYSSTSSSVWKNTVYNASSMSNTIYINGWKAGVEYFWTASSPTGNTTTLTTYGHGSYNNYSAGAHTKNFEVVATGVIKVTKPASASYLIINQRPSVTSPIIVSNNYEGYAIDTENGALTCKTIAVNETLKVAGWVMSATELSNVNFIVDTTNNNGLNYLKIHGKSSTDGTIMFTFSSGTTADGNAEVSYDIKEILQKAKEIWNVG